MRLLFGGSSALVVDLTVGVVLVFLHRLRSVSTLFVVLVVSLLLITRVLLVVLVVDATLVLLLVILEV